MGVTVRLHPFLSEGRETHYQVEGQSTGECIEEVIRRCPGAEKKMFAKPGHLQRHVEVLVNGSSTHPNELGAPVVSGDVVSVLVFLAGG
jgi:hypothetical protein